MAGLCFNGLPMTFSASSAKTASGNTGNLKDSATPFPICQAFALILDVTASSSPTTLDVGVETSIDGGTTWYAAYEFTQIGAVSTAKRRLDVRDTGIGITEVGADTSIVETNNSIKNNTILTRDIRIYWTISGTSYTFAIHGIFQPLGTQI